MKLLLGFLMAWLSCVVYAGPLTPVPQNDPALQVRLEPRFGAAVPQRTVWLDENGSKVTLGQVLNGKPAVLVLAYYHCPMLCPRVLQSLAATVGNSNDFRGGELNVVAASIDPRDDFKMAASARDQFVQRANAPRESAHFLTGPEQSSRHLAQAVGIHYVYDAAHGEYAHPAVLILLDATGHVARYLPAFTTTARDLRLALAEVNTGVKNNLWDHVLLLCYAYDPHSGRYTLAITTILRIAGLVTVLLLAIIFWRLQKKPAA